MLPTPTCFAGAKRERHWRSLEEWSGVDGFREFLELEFPYLARCWDIPVKRREVLKLMAASVALAGIGGCSRQPAEEIVPYVRAPERTVPGKPLHYATTLTLGGYARGVLVESHMGRPTKVEGNPLHPASLGATDLFAQASVLELYDPDRSKLVTHGGEASSWEAFRKDLAARTAALGSADGSGLYLLTETLTSPTLGQQLRELLRAYPLARWHQYDPLGRDSVRAGAVLAFGRPVETRYRFEKARVILSLDGDFLASVPGHVRYAHDFAAGRRVRRDQAAMSRLYAIESTPTLTGAMADHRLALQAGRIEAVARSLAGRLGLGVAPAKDHSPLLPDAWIAAVTQDLQTHRGDCLVFAGDHQTPTVHALVQAMNERLGNFGRTVVHTEPVEIVPTDQMRSLRLLVDDMKAGKADTLFILGGNPVYDAPADLGFAEALSKVPLRVHWGQYADETARQCHWHVPALHELESWGDARAHDGTVGLLQPLIAPLHGGQSLHALLALLLGDSASSDRDIVRNYWRNRQSAADFDGFWNRALRDGFVPETEAQPRKVSVRADLPRILPPPQPVPEAALEVQFRPDPTLRDGRHANNGWLQELPKPLTQLTWGNPALLGPKTAERLGLRNGEVVKLGYRGRTIEIPVWIMPGHADESVTLYLGHGRQRAGRVGDGIGVDSYALRASDTPWFGFGLSLRKLDTGRVAIPTTQHHHGMDGHELVRTMTLQAFQSSPPKPAEPPSESLYPAHAYEGYAWGMTIDQNACIGCNACVIACQAENNVPIVGREEVLRGREMHWLRVDRYYAGTPENPGTYFQPVPCMQCELAPCEPVCPVHASVHDSEGINNQVYNRCVGTRTCQSNCPYKVRRFNFFDYAAATATHEGELAALRNPDVTVRSRGVMEKCTYCIQRISAARIEAEKADRLIRDGEVVTACQAACPTRAIVFGNLNDPGSQVAKAKAQPHHYALLAELNTRPRTTYLARLGNPNPELQDG